eukprot:7250227-Pyramimonas_sp.AAC.1
MGTVKSRLAKDPNIRSCEYRNSEYHLRPSSEWGHETRGGRADMRGGAQRERCGRAARGPGSAREP